jgi:hypothetical protein
MYIFIYPSHFYTVILMCYQYNTFEVVHSTGVQLLYTKMFQLPTFLLTTCVQNTTQAGHNDGIINIIFSRLSVNSWRIKYSNTRRLGIIIKFSMQTFKSAQKYSLVTECLFIIPVVIRQHYCLLPSQHDGKWTVI